MNKKTESQNLEVPLEENIRSLEQIQEHIKELDSDLEESDPLFEGAIILLSMVVLGENSIPKSKEIQKFSNLPLDLIEEFIENLKTGGVLVEETLYHSGWSDKETGIIAFFMDVFIGLGFLDRGADSPVLEEKNEIMH